MLSYMSHSGLNARCQTSFVTRVCVCACVTTRLHKWSVNDVQAAEKCRLWLEWAQGRGFSETLRQQHCEHTL